MLTKAALNTVGIDSKGLTLRVTVRKPLQRIPTLPFHATADLGLLVIAAGNSKINAPSARWACLLPVPVGYTPSTQSAHPPSIQVAYPLYAACIPFRELRGK